MPINNNNNGGGYNLNIPTSRPTWLQDYINEMPDRRAAVLGKPYVKPNSFSGYTPVESREPFSPWEYGFFGLRPIAELSLLNPDGSLRSDYEASAQQFFNDQYNSDLSEYATSERFKNLIDQANANMQYAHENEEAWNQEREKLQNQNHDLTSERDFYRDRWNATRPKIKQPEIKQGPKYTNEANEIMSKFDGNQWDGGFRAKLYGDIANGNFNNFMAWPKEVKDAVIAAGLIKNDPRQTPVTPHINLDNTVRTIGNTMVSPYVKAYNMVKGYFDK